MLMMWLVSSCFVYTKKENKAQYAKERGPFKTLSLLLFLALSIFEITPDQLRASRLLNQAVTAFSAVPRLLR